MTGLIAIIPPFQYMLPSGADKKMARHISDGPFPRRAICE
jgi:hypothetical protein